jgi:hypothetical protein
VVGLVAVVTPNAETVALIAAARPFAHCTHGWPSYGYYGKTCLEIEGLIGDPSYPKDDWFPYTGPCDGCNLRRVLPPNDRSGTR